MDAKIRNLALLGTGVALIFDHLVLGLVFFVLGGVAAVEIAWNHSH